MASATILMGGKPVALVERATADETRLLDTMTFWGSEASWLDHRFARITHERDALIAWCDRNIDWHDPRLRRRNRRITTLSGLRNVVREHLADIAKLVDTLVKKHPREMSRLTERFAIARCDTPPPATRPTTAPVSAAEWGEAMTRGWKSR